MTSILFQNFNQRSKEVGKYFIFLKSLQQGTLIEYVRDKLLAK